MDMEVISGAIVGLNGAISLVKGIKASQEEKVELQGKLLDTKSALVDMKQEMLELHERLRITEDLEFREGAYWSKSDESGPYCARCRDGSSNAVRMAKVPTRDQWECTVCARGACPEFGHSSSPRTRRRDDTETDPKGPLLDLDDGYQARQPIRHVPLAGAVWRSARLVFWI